MPHSRLKPTPEGMEVYKDITVNLVAITTCTPELRAVIERDGVEL